MKRLKLAVTGGVLALLAWRMDWHQIGQIFAGIRLSWWLAAIGLYCSLQVVSGLRWQMLARPLGLQRPTSHFVGFYFIGMFFNLMLPTSVGGDVVRGWYLDGGSGRRFKSYVSVLVDRASGLLVLLSLACTAVLLTPGLPGWVQGSVWFTVGGAAFMIAVALILSRHHRAGNGDQGVKLSKKQLLFQAMTQCRETYLGRPRLLVLATLLSVVIQAGNVVVVWLVGRAIDAPVPSYYYWVVVPMVSLLTLLPSINGIGIREGGMVVYLQEVGVPASTALSLSVLWFAVFTAASLLGGLVYLLGVFPRPEGTQHEPVRGDSNQGRTGQLEAAA